MGFKTQHPAFKAVELATTTPPSSATPSPANRYLGPSPPPLFCPSPMPLLQVRGKTVSLPSLVPRPEQVSGYELSQGAKMMPHPC